MAGPDLGHIAGPVTIPNCVQVALQWTQPNGRVAENVMHGRVASGFAPSSTIANAIFAALNGSGAFTTLNALLSIAGNFKGVRLLDMRSPSLAPVESTSAQVAGASTSDPMSPSTSLVITERTARAGQAFRGRIYVPNWSINATGGDGRADGATVTALQAWADTIIGALSASAVTLAIAQPARALYTGSTGTVHPARSPNLVDVTECVVRNNIWDNQRRRGGRS